MSSLLSAIRERCFPRCKETVTKNLGTIQQSFFNYTERQRNKKVRDKYVELLENMKSITATSEFDDVKHYYYSQPKSDYNNITQQLSPDDQKREFDKYKARIKQGEEVLEQYRTIVGTLEKNGISLEYSKHAEGVLPQSLYNLIKNNPDGALRQLNACIRKRKDIPDNVVFIYLPELTGREGPSHPLKILLKKKREAKGEAKKGEKAKYQALLDHPLIAGIVRRKWKHTGLPLHGVNMALYLLFLCLFTQCIVSNKPTFIAESDVAMHSNNVTFSNNPDACQIKDSKHPVVYLKDAVVSFSVFFLMKEVWQWYIGIISIFFAWINVLFFLKKLDILLISGIPVNLFQKITWKFFVNVFVVLIVFIIAFGIVFHSIFSTYHGFETVGQSITKTLAMMIGELDYSSLFVEETPKFFYLGLTFYVAFIFVMAIVMMNLMIGIAVEDVQEIQKSAVAENTDLKIDYVMYFEPIILWILNKFCKNKTDASKAVQGDFYEKINLKKKSETKGLPVRKIMDILCISDEKSEEQSRHESIMNQFSELMEQIKIMATNESDEQARFESITNDLREEMAQIKQSMNKYESEAKKMENELKNIIANTLDQKQPDRGQARSEQVEKQLQDELTVEFRTTKAKMSELEEKIDTLTNIANSFQNRNNERSCLIM